MPTPIELQLALDLVFQAQPNVLCANAGDGTLDYVFRGMPVTLGSPLTGSTSGGAYDSRMFFVF